MRGFFVCGRVTRHLIGQRFRFVREVPADFLQPINLLLLRIDDPIQIAYGTIQKGKLGFEFVNDIVAHCVTVA